MIRIINGSELKGKVKDVDSEYFYGTSGRKTEEEYRQLVEDSQSYFDGILSGTIKPTDNYFIYAPAYYLEHGFATEIAVIKNDSTTAINARLLYIEKPVKVKAISDGYIFQSNDGRHRYAVAQKYQLNLLVDVVEDLPEVENEDIKKENLITKIINILFNHGGTNYGK